MWEDFLIFVAVGFAAQMVDGAIGMAYGLTGTSVLLSLGVPPATASACVHAAEVFTTGASGFAHWRFGNVRSDLIWKLAVPGMIGGSLGAYVLSSFEGDAVRPVINVYLFGMGLLILWRAWNRSVPRPEAPRKLLMLGLAGGFVDAIGGGGWGPLVSSTLIGRGTTARFAIGSVNLAEFFVTATITGTFLATIGLDLWPIIAGLILGGVIAAPLAAYATMLIPNRPLMVLVGVIISLLSLHGLVQWLS